MSLRLEQMAQLDRTLLWEHGKENPSADHCAEIPQVFNAVEIVLTVGKEGSGI